MGFDKIIAVTNLSDNLSGPYTTLYTVCTIYYALEIYALCSPLTYELMIRRQAYVKCEDCHIYCCFIVDLILYVYFHFVTILIIERLL